MRTNIFVRSGNKIIPVAKPPKNAKGEGKSVLIERPKKINNRSYKYSTTAK